MDFTTIPQSALWTALIHEAISYGIKGALTAGAFTCPLLFFNRFKLWTNIMAWGFEIASLGYIGIVLIGAAALAS